MADYNAYFDMFNIRINKTDKLTTQQFLNCCDLFVDTLDYYEQQLDHTIKFCDIQMEYSTYNKKSLSLFQQLKFYFDSQNINNLFYDMICAEKKRSDRLLAKVNNNIIALLENVANENYLQDSKSIQQQKKLSHLFTDYVLNSMNNYRYLKKEFDAYCNAMSKYNVELVDYPKIILDYAKIAKKNIINTKEVLAQMQSNFQCILEYENKQTLIQR